MSERRSFYEQQNFVSEGLIFFVLLLLLIPANFIQFLLEKGGTFLDRATFC